jgi:hypothetical protein
VRSSICLLLVLLSLTFALVSCTRKSVTGVEVDPSLKGYILPKSKVLAGVSVDQIKQTDFYKRHQAQLALPALDQFSQQVGVDPRRDLSSFLMAWNGTDVLGMIRGDFSSANLEKYPGAKTRSEHYNKFTLFGDGKRDLVFVPKGIALIGSSVLLKKALNDDAAGDTGVPEDIQLQLSRLDAGAQAWVVSSGIIQLDQLSMRSDAATTLSNISDYIDATAAGITVSSGIALDGHISCISEEGAQRVHDALRGVIGLARLTTPDNRMDQLRLWDSIKVDKQGKDIHLTAELTPELADSLITLLPSLTKRF